MILAFVAVLFGLCIGSFLNVCIYRLPLGRSVVTPRSCCPKCQQVIPWYRNIPVFSYVCLKGKSKCCQSPISLIYPSVELLTGLIFGLNFYYSAPSIALSNSVFMSSLVVASFIDLEHLYIPDTITLGGILLSFCIAFVWPFLSGSNFSIEILALSFVNGLLPTITSASLSAGLLFLIACFAEKVFKQEALGLGDVKLLGFIGAYCSYYGAIFAIFVGSLLALVILIPLLSLQKILKKPLHGSTQWNKQCQLDPMLAQQAKNGKGWGIRIPFGPWLCAGAILYLFWQEGLLQWIKILDLIQ